ncbi:MAG: hypothetical protein JSV80_16370, partial [Acidobacteriota bacterium]
ALLPDEDPDGSHQGIERIDRTTVLELREIPSEYTTIEACVDRADVGLNPLGLARDVAPFDIDPTFLDVASTIQGKSHFEQVYDRAMGALDNAVIVYDYANQLSQSLRRHQDSVEDFARNVRVEERDLKYRLIEIFGYPYSDDMGPDGTYASGYDGPDLYHYMYVDSSELTGDAAPHTEEITAYFTPIPETSDYDLPVESVGEPVNTKIKEVTYTVALDGTGLVKPTSWTGRRRAPGEIQNALSDLYQNRARYERALQEYSNLLELIEDKADELEARYDLQTEEIRLLNENRGEQVALSGWIAGAKTVKLILGKKAEDAQTVGDILAEAVPKSFGFSNDALAGLRGVLRFAARAAAFLLRNLAIGAEITTYGLEVAKEDAALSSFIELETERNDYKIKLAVKELEQVIRREAVARLELYTQAEVLQQSLGRYYAKLAEGERLLARLVAFRRAMAGQMHSHRYRDMAYRVFRNDAVQKYRAQFDLAARYAYLAAKAYDYETNLLGSSGAAGQHFLTDIVKHRSLGHVIDGQPIAGSRGLADPLARLDSNYSVLEGQLGFNNPQTETNRFSLRKELFRISPDTSADGTWQDTLTSHRVADLWQVPEFRRYARPFTGEMDQDGTSQPQPGLVIPFSTTVTFAQNFFGHGLAGGDSAYDPSHFSTKIRAVGIWFTDYDQTGLSNTPRVYLIPAGMAVLRSPTGSNFDIRTWRVVDQKLPVPFPVESTDLADPNWIPIHDSLAEELGGIRRHPALRAYHDAGQADPEEMTANARLVGRSVWNTSWVLIIPGGTLLAEPNQGLDDFIASVSDIKLLFQTYSFFGN